MFKLLIECTKDISEIHINFTDGTSVVTSEKPEPTKPDKKPEPTKPDKKPSFSEARRELLDLDDSSTPSNISNVKPSQVLKPEIANHDRQVKVATELQNLDI